MSKSDFTDDPARLRKTTVLLLTLVVSAAFVGMVRGFLISLLLATLFSAIAYPLYERLFQRFGRRKMFASGVTIFVLLTLVLIPLLGLLGLATVEAHELSQTLVPWVQQRIETPEMIGETIPEWIPYRKQLQHPSSQVLSKVSELSGIVGGFLISGISAATTGTATFFLNLFVMLYAMFWLFQEGPPLRDKVLAFTPLPTETKHLLVDKAVGVTRATIKGTLVVGIVQGGLAGLAFAVLGIEGAIFWGIVMALLSIIPGVGTALVWIPAVIYLFACGQTWSAIGLTVWCAGLVGTIDNVLRPRLVGRDTQMTDLMVLVSMLGGLATFGAVGILLGPILGGIFVTTWEVYGYTFRDLFCNTGSTDG